MALCAVLLVTGGTAVGVHRSGHQGRAAVRRGYRSAPSRATAPAATGDTGAGPATSTQVVPGPATTGGNGPPPPGTAALEAGLITPADMGGYYREVPSVGQTTLGGASCLAVLQPSADQGGRAVTALLGPDAYSVPTIGEEVASYRGTGAGAAYGALVKEVSACPSFTLSFGGRTVTSRLAPTGIPPVGDADRVWSGGFGYGGSSFSLEAAVVLDGQDVLVVVWVDRVPPSDPVMGSFTSTVSLAIGKLA